MSRIPRQCYASQDYARAVAGTGEAFELPFSGAWFIKNQVNDSTLFDISATYPLLQCRDWSRLDEDLSKLKVVSATAVTDPFAILSSDELQRAFPDHLRRWKNHYVAVLDSTDPLAHVSSHHRRYARQAFKKVEVEITENPSEWTEEWLRLYSHLKIRHDVTGPPDFNETSLRQQLNVPGLIAHRALLDGDTVSMLLWIRSGQNCYYHLGASTPAGYEAHASFALFWSGLSDLAHMGIQQLDLGAAAGNSASTDTGLSTFKRGWSNEQLPTWLGGRIIDPDAYASLAQADAGTQPCPSHYFPAYRRPHEPPQTQTKTVTGTVDNTATTMQNSSRTKAHMRNVSLELLLGEMNKVIASAPDPEVIPGSRPLHPVVLVVGGPRSGSTMTMQYLAASGAFAYPTNLLSRFSSAPALGARIQLLLTDPRYDHHAEFADVGSEVSFSSELGKSSGVLQPHEFWYFWRRFFPIEEPRQLSEAELTQADMQGFLSEMAAIERILGKPLALKGMLLQLNAAFLAETIKNVIFVDIERDPFFQCQSLLLARRSFFGNTDQWYSTKPPEYEWLQDEDPYTQIAGQVYFGRKHLNEQLESVDASRHVHLSYATMCADPDILLDRLETALTSAGSPQQLQRPNRRNVRSSDRMRISDEEANGLLNAYARLLRTDTST